MCRRPSLARSEAVMVAPASKSDRQNTLCGDINRTTGDGGICFAPGHQQASSGTGQQEWGFDGCITAMDDFMAA
jgi:hypothetical protein